MKLLTNFIEKLKTVYITTSGGSAKISKTRLEETMLNSNLTIVSLEQYRDICNNGIINDRRI